MNALGIEPKAFRVQHGESASAGNRTRVTSMATMYSTTRPLMLLLKEHRVTSMATMYSTTRALMLLLKEHRLAQWER